MTERCEWEKRWRNPERRAENEETVLIGGEKGVSGQRNWDTV